MEIKQEIEKYKLIKHSGIYLDEDEQESMEMFASGPNFQQERANGQKRVGVAIEVNQPELSHRYIEGVSVEEQLSATVRARADLSGSASVASNNKPRQAPQ